MGIFDREPCFVTKGPPLYKSDPSSSTYWTDSLITSASSIAAHGEGARGEMGKALTEKMIAFKENDPAGYARFNDNMKASKGSQGGLAQLMRDQTSTTLNNFDQIVAAGKESPEALKGKLQSLKDQTAGMASERDQYNSGGSNPYVRREQQQQPQQQQQQQQQQAAPVTADPTAARRTSYVAPETQVGGRFSPSVDVPSMASGGGFGGGFGGGTQGSSMRMDTSGFSGVMKAITSIIDRFTRGGGDGEAFSNATEGFARHSSQAALSRAPDPSMSFNVGGKNFGNVLAGLDLASLRMGNMGMSAAATPEPQGLSAGNVVQRGVSALMKMDM